MPTSSDGWTLYRLVKGVLIASAVGLIVVLVLLVAYGFQTDWQGTKKYPPNPEYAALLTGKNIVAYIEIDLRSGRSLKEAEKRLAWERLLTDWHERDDIVLKLTSSDRENVDGGTITFLATNDSPEFVYDAATKRIRK